MKPHLPILGVRPHSALRSSHQRHHLYETAQCHLTLLLSTLWSPYTSSTSWGCGGRLPRSIGKFWELAESSTRNLLAYLELQGSFHVARDTASWTQQGLGLSGTASASDLPPGGGWEKLPRRACGQSPLGSPPTALTPPPAPPAPPSLGS